MRLKVIPCEHWSEGGKGWGRCALGLHEGRPSHGTCRSCEHYPRISRSAAKSSITPQALNVMGNALHGAASIAKTTLGIDRASDEQVEARLNVCRQCPGGHAVWKEGDVHTCGPMLQSMRDAGHGTCGCILHKKARDLDQACPFGWWPQSTSAKRPTETVKP